jgi:protein Mpv17
MTIAEGGGRRAVSHKLRDMYIPTLKANFMVWPLVQIINFRLMPLQFQLVGMPLLPNLSSVLISTTALRLVRWYCLDGISFTVECR